MRTAHDHYESGKFPRMATRYRWNRAHDEDERTSNQCRSKDRDQDDRQGRFQCKAIESL